MTYRFFGGSNPLGGSGPPATYFDPNKTDEPARAASLTKLYGKPTCSVLGVGIGAAVYLKKRK